jgi:RNA polymerase-binding transcription factor DksA
MYGPPFPLGRREARSLIFVIKLALYALFIALLLRRIGRWSRRRRPNRVDNPRDRRPDGDGTIPAAGGNRLAPVSELRAIWPDHAPEEDPEEDKEMAPELTGPTATTATPPSPADDARRLEGIVAELAEVEAALRRLDDGSYGICDACGSRLSTESLAADPLTTRCPQHAA